MKKIFFSLLREALCDIPLEKEVKSLLTPEILVSLFNLSDKHDLAHLVCDALNKNGLLSQNSEIKKRFIAKQHLAVYRSEQFIYELNCISQAFSDESISFMPLKGSVLRSLYKEPWMRTSCDIDVLVKEENLKPAIKVLTEKLGYKCTGIGMHDAQLYSENGTHIELHYNLLGIDTKQSEKEIFDNVFEVSKEISPYQFSMPDEYFYCYTISHIAKHLKDGGCGVRPLLDLWILNNKVAFDQKKREELLKKAGLLTLAKALEKLCRVWFDEKEPDELTNELGEYILTGGVYGTFETKIAMQQSLKKNKISYFLSRLFLPYRQMKFKYPKLQKCPILYPYYTVKRWFLIFRKDTKNRAVKELNQARRGDKAVKERTEKLLKELKL